MDLGVTDKVKPLIDKVRQMVSDDIEPLDQEADGSLPNDKWKY